MDYFFNFEKLTYLKAGRPEGCILCMVRDGSESVDRLVVHETGLFLVSLNLYPYNPGHVLVFPKRHVTDVRTLDARERLELAWLTDFCLDALERLFSPGGFNIGYNMGLAAGASIDHLHMHIIPRFPRELGIVELIAGKRVLVQDPRETMVLLRQAFEDLAHLHAGSDDASTAGAG